MPLVKKLQKAFYFSSERKKKFIESRLEDLAVQQDRSTSYVIESLLTDALLPDHKEAKSLIYNFLYADQDCGVQKTLTAAFDYNSSGCDWHSRHKNFLPLLEFCLAFCTDTSRCTGTEMRLEHFRSQLRDITIRIADCTASCIEPYDRIRYESLAGWAKALYEKALEDPTNIVFREHFELVRDCWEMLDDWSITYRYLCDLAAMCEFEESDDCRSRLYSIIDDLSKGW